MKKIVFIWLLMTWSGFAQVYYFENFRTTPLGSLPTGWILKDGGLTDTDGNYYPGDSTWSVVDKQDPFSTDSLYLGNSNFLFIGYLTAIVQQDTLISPQISVGPGTGKVYLEFQYVYQLSYKDTVKVAVFDGTQWQILQYWIWNPGAVTLLGDWHTKASRPGKAKLDLTPYVNPNLRVAFVAIGSQYGKLYAGIDQVSVYRETSYDLTIDSVFVGNPDLLCPFSTAEPVKIKIKNLGTQNAVNSVVSYQLYKDDIPVGNAVTETLSVSIPGNDSLYYTFSQTINISQPGKYKLITWINDDTLYFNDTLVCDSLYLYEISPTKYFLETCDGISQYSLGKGWRAPRYYGVQYEYTSPPEYHWRGSQAGTYPVLDHTGNYTKRILETNPYGTNRGPATLYSPCFLLNSVQETDLGFWYHIYDEVDSLVIDVAGTPATNSVWTKIGKIVGQQQFSSSAPWKQLICNVPDTIP